jgi:hypothetical protein
MYSYCLRQASSVHLSDKIAENIGDSIANYSPFVFELI